MRVDGLAASSRPFASSCTSLATPWVNSRPAAWKCCRGSRGNLSIGKSTTLTPARTILRMKCRVACRSASRSACILRLCLCSSWPFTMCVPACSFLSWIRACVLCLWVSARLFEITDLTGTARIAGLALPEVQEEIYSKGGERASSELRNSCPADPWTAAR